MSLEPVLRFDPKSNPVLSVSPGTRNVRGRRPPSRKKRERGGASPQRDTPHNNSQSSICESICFALDDIPKLALGMSAEEFGHAKADLHCVEAWIYTGEACVGDVQVA